MKNMLVFDFKQSEKNFFEENKLADTEMKFFEKSLNEQTVKTVSAEDKQNAQIISVFINSNVSKEVLDSFPNLKLIATRSTGFNHIDNEECKKRGIAIVNVAKYGETTVAQYTFGLLIAIVRNVVPAIMDMKISKNKADEYIGRDLNAMTIGVLGTGAIGAKICELAHAFGMKILAYDFHPNDELANKYNITYTDFETLMKESDVVSVHVPYREENHHLISANAISMMKQGAYLVNTSRGELVDTNAVYQALLDKKLAGVALDVGECESISFAGEQILDKLSGTPANCLARALVTQKLIELDNVIVTPHIAYNTQEAVHTILETTFNNIKAFYKGEMLNRIV